MRASPAKLDRARIPVVLLDRCFMPYPERSSYDLIGIDNRRAGYLATEHLLDRGAGRIAFVARAHSASTVDSRLAGYRDALAHGPARPMVLRPEAMDPASILPFHRRRRPEAYLCANDRTAGELMHVLLAAGVRIPEEALVAGIDDVEYASLLPVPLTTVHQPCREIGEAAAGAMLERIARPEMPAREILLECRLVVRASSGG